MTGFLTERQWAMGAVALIVCMCIPMWIVLDAANGPKPLASATVTVAVFALVILIPALSCWAAMISSIIKEPRA